MNKPFEIFEEYRKASDFKSALGKRGLYEQNRINERFYIGDQWYGAKCGNDRPLVRHNIIKRIGDYKMSQILNSPLSVTFSAEGIPNSGSAQDERIREINTAMSALGNYYSVTAERVGLTSLYAHSETPTSAAREFYTPIGTVTLRPGFMRTENPEYR